MKSFLLSALIFSILPMNNAHAQFGFLEGQMQSLNREINHMMSSEATDQFEIGLTKQKMQSDLEAFNQEFGNNEMQIKIYEGVSSFKGEDKQTKSCVVGMAFDKESKKIRNFKILSNIDFGIVDSALVKSATKLINEQFQLNIDADFTNEQLKERSNKYSYISLNVLPNNEEHENNIKKYLAEQKFVLNLEKFGELKASLYLDYKLEKNLLSKRVKTLALEQGIKTPLFKYSLVNLDADYDTKNEQFKNFKVKAGVGMGINATLECENLREL